MLSNGFITSLIIASVQPGAGFLWPAINKLVLAVPEPGSSGLMVAGLVVVGLIARHVYASSFAI